MTAAGILRLAAALLGLLALVAPAQAEKRVALVVGNAAYVDATPLRNPANDASDMAQSLRRLGFEVVEGIDLDNDAMRRKVKEFSDALPGADVALFFYAGHAVQVGGQNYLAPVDTDLRKESDLDFETISLDFVLRQMEREARTLLVFLDSCRDNPLTRRLTRLSRSQSSSPGLARPETSGEGAFISFATQPGNVALDGDGRNSPFTGALLANIERPGVEISALMTDVRRQVYEATGEQQLPWTNSSLLGQFFFKPGDLSTAAQDTAASERERRLARLVAEAARFEALRKDDAAQIEAFLADFPDGIYAALAGGMLRDLRAAKGETAIASLPQPSNPNDVPNDDKNAEVATPDRDAVRSLQQELARIGCNPGRPDGLWGKASRAALSEYARHSGANLATLEPTAALLEQLKQRKDRVCPLQCGPGETERGGRCVASVQRQQKTANAPSRPATQQAPVRNRPAQRKSSSACFNFNGKLICD
jgi:uncharacterized caspase-like protein